MTTIISVIIRSNDIKLPIVYWFYPPKWQFHMIEPTVVRSATRYVTLWEHTSGAPGMASEKEGSLRMLISWLCWGTGEGLKYWDQHI